MKLALPGLGPRIRETSDNVPKPMAAPPRTCLGPAAEPKALAHSGKVGRWI
jgi:hypothetical protein